MTEIETEEETPFILLTPFIVELMERSARDTAWAADAVTDHLERRAVRAETTLELIRGRIENLYAGDYAPTEHAVLEVLYPSDELVDAVLEVRRRMSA